ncbi:MAG: TolC family protein [Muribaculaceae bacterium]|nr:TolC family protein [Muribaculaceae bacterium]
MLKNKLILILTILLTIPMALGQTLRIDRDECRRMALKHSENLKKAENGVTQSELDCKIARTAYLPKFDASASAIYMLPDIDMMGAKMQTHGAYLAGIQLVQPIYAGGKITAGRKLSDLGRHAAQNQFEISRMDVLNEADNAYWTYIAVRDKVRLMQSYIDMIDTLYLQTKTAVDAGMAMGNDLLRIIAKRSELQYQKKKAENGAELCRQALCNIIGANYETAIEPTDTLPECVAPYNMDYDITSRPEYKLLQLNIDVARQQVNMVKGDFLPTVGVSLGYSHYGNIKMKGIADLGDGNYYPYTQEYRDGIATGVLSVSIPLFHWGEGMKKVRKAKLSVDNAMLDFNRNADLLDLEVRQAATNLEDGWNMISSAKLALDLATENLRVMQNRYDEAVSPLTDLLEAQTQWQQARSNMIEAATQYQIYQTAWLRATGRL